MLDDLDTLAKVALFNPAHLCNQCPQKPRRGLLSTSTCRGLSNSLFIDWTDFLLGGCTLLGRHHSTLNIHSSNFVASRFANTFQSSSLEPPFTQLGSCCFSRDKQLFLFVCFVLGGRVEGLLCHFENVGQSNILSTELPDSMFS